MTINQTPTRRQSRIRLRAARFEPAPEILVVEDEPLLRASIVRELTAAGYPVKAVDSSERALELLRANRGEFRLVLSDIGLPGASGIELVAEIRRSWPGLVTQLMSATAKETLVAQGRLSRETHLLRKPFSGRELVSRIRVLLGRAARSAMH